MTVRCKFKVKSIHHLYTGGDTDVAVEVKLMPVWESREGVEGNACENRWFAKWTPQGEITLMITNRDAVDQFEIGADYYVDLTRAVNLATA